MGGSMNFGVHRGVLFLFFLVVFFSKKTVTA
jgi:hypothetical protein